MDGALRGLAKQGEETIQEVFSENAIIVKPKDQVKNASRRLTVASTTLGQVGNAIVPGPFEPGYYYSIGSVAVSKDGTLVAILS